MYIYKIMDYFMQHLVNFKPMIDKYLYILSCVGSSYIPISNI